ncbi:MAG TPA: DUF1905 domain-containing protein, partial [Chloroflexia bacterium]|nr:DUF1905 domain-containing protein [Chloroflexia bacterium]
MFPASHPGCQHPHDPPTATRRQSNMAETFTTTILQAEGLNATGISVPPGVIAALGTQKRPKVVVTLNGYTYRTTVAPFGDVF